MIKSSAIYRIGIEVWKGSYRSSRQSAEDEMCIFSRDYSFSGSARLASIAFELCGLRIQKGCIGTDTGFESRLL